MENQSKHQKSSHSDSHSLPPQEDFTLPESSPRHGGDHISLSPPLGSPGNSLPDSYSSPLHSKQGSGEHISLSPPVGSPARSSLASDHATGNQSHGSSPENEIPPAPEKKPPSPEKKPPPVVLSRDVFKEPMENRVVIEEPLAIVSRAVLEEPKADPGSGVAEGGGGGSGRRRFRPTLSILRRAKRDKIVRKAALGFRVFGFLFCLVSFSVMAADRNQGWALDSFDRYKEFRYCMSVNVIGFVYSGAQAVDSFYNLATGKYIVHHQQKLRYYLDFALDQMIAYLLISASSSATIRVDDWQSNWGKDRFPDFAIASISMSFLAFVALASSSLISGYALCTSKSM